MYLQLICYNLQKQINLLYIIRSPQIIKTQVRTQIHSNNSKWMYPNHLWNILVAKLLSYNKVLSLFLWTTSPAGLYVSRESLPKAATKYVTVLSTPLKAQVYLDITAEASSRGAWLLCGGGGGREAQQHTSTRIRTLLSRSFFPVAPRSTVVGEGSGT